MATTNRLAAQILTLGQAVTAAAFAPAAEPLTLQLTVTQVVASQVRMIVFDLGSLQRIGSMVIAGTDTQKMVLEGIRGNVLVQVMCTLGSAQVQLDDLSGSTAFGAQIQTADIVAGALAASAAGRALLADDYFTTAEFVAGAGGKFAPNCMDGVACANVFPNGAIPVAKVASAPFSLETVIADPGDGNPIPVVSSGTCILTVGAGVETRTVADPGAAGLVIQVQTTVFGIGSLAVVFASDITTVGGENSVAFTAAGQTFVVVSLDIGAGFKWRVLSNPQALVIS